MTYRIIWSQRSKRDLQSIQKNVCSRIIAKIPDIRVHPHPYAKRLVRIPLYSLQIGEYRAILDIKAGELIIFVISVGHRHNVYDAL